jgi:predicted Zn-dependent protease
MSSLPDRLWLFGILAVPLFLAEGAIAAQPDALSVSGADSLERSACPKWSTHLAEPSPDAPVAASTGDESWPSLQEGSLARPSSLTLSEFEPSSDMAPLLSLPTGAAVGENIAGEVALSGLPNLPNLLEPLTVAAEFEATGDGAGAVEEPAAEGIAPDAPTTAPTEAAAPAPDTPTAKPTDSPAIAPSPTTADPDEVMRLLSEGDALWQMGLRQQAEARYRLAKAPFDETTVAAVLPSVVEPAALPPEGQVYWREAEAGRSQNSRPRMESALRLLTEEYPEFVPGHLRYAEVLAGGDRPDEALAVLERAVGLYPDSADLARARVAALAENRQLVEAAIAARQFALMHPEDPAAPEFEALAAQHTETFRNRLERDLRAGAIANLLTGALGFALTGNLFGPISSIQTGIALLRGEENVGEAIARRAARQVPLIQDEAVNAYVKEIGQRLAAMTGRSEFEYEFFIIRDRTLNAFALPGGKIFINAGAILKARSEAELAGLIAHELAHTSLSHGFQLAVDANTLGNAFQLIPYGGYAANLLYFNYSRDMERQADAFGTRLLASADYAADGLHGLMVTLEQQERRVAPFEWLSTHPDTAERQRNIERQIRQNGYNRYAYEGVDRHAAMRLQVQTELGLSRLKKPTPESDS